MPSTCPTCPAGSFVQNSQCKTCAAGTFTSQAGSTSCQDCPADTYSSSGATLCTSCPAGTTSSKVGVWRLYKRFGLKLVSRRDPRAVQDLLPVQVTRLVPQAISYKIRSASLALLVRSVPRPDPHRAKTALRTPILAPVPQVVPTAHPARRVPQ